MNVAIIGNGTHSKRIQKILKTHKIFFSVFKGEKPSYLNNNDFKKIEKYDAVFILSSNYSHARYIKRFKKKYIFCEKPPVLKKEDISFLKKINRGKIYFNFNYRFSIFTEALLKYKKKLGKLIFVNLVSTHGLSLTKKYKSDWRSKKKFCKTGVLEILSIHLIDILFYVFNEIKVKNIRLINHSKIGSSFDTSFSSFENKSNAIINVFSTYYSSYIKKNLFLFSDGYIEQNENYLEVRGPSSNFDKNGYFIKPKIMERIRINSKLDYHISLEKSVKFFIKKVKSGNRFKKKDFNCSLISNSLIV